MKEKEGNVTFPIPWKRFMSFDLSPPHSSVKDFSAGVQDINSKDVLELMWVHGPPLSPPLYADS